MLGYTEEQIKVVIQNILNKDVTIHGIGNHELKRHLVYLVTDDKGNKNIFKLYCKKNRCNREVASLKVLSSSNIKAPKLIKYGNLQNGDEWIIIEFLEGKPFEKVKHNINKNDQLRIMKQMGKELGKIHKFREFNYFGNWDKDANSIDKAIYFRTVFIRRAEITISNLLAQKLPERNLHVKAVESLRQQYELIDSVKTSRLCHNDFDGRNILVTKTEKTWDVTGVIDFEQCLPWDKDNDLAILYHKYFLSNSKYKNAFFSGYNEYFKNHDISQEKLDFYLLYIGIVICSWTYENVKDYYEEGIKLIKRYI